MKKDPVVLAKGRLGGLLRAAEPDFEAVDQARTELTMLNCERYIQRALAATPPMTREQRKRLAALLTDGLS